MLQNSLGLILLDRLRHHIQDIVHDSSSQLKIVMRFHALLRDRFRDTFAIPAFELTSKQVAQPIFFDVRKLDVV